MAITKTLLALRTLTAKEADVTVAAGTDATKRHDTTEANVYLNDSYREYLTLMTTRGFDYFCLETALAPLPTSRADTNEQYSLIDWPSNALALKRLDVYVAGEWHELLRRDWSQLRSESRSVQSTASRPFVYAVKTIGSVSGATLSAGKIGIAPFSSNGSYKSTYLPEWANITNDAHLFLFHDEVGAQWTMWNTVIKYSAQDNNAKKRYEIASVQLEKCAATIGHFVPQIAATGPLTVTRSPDYNR
jgi:hypothetical protein